MNKIIRIASVFALACAALLYAGCTKDFSSDIARLEVTDGDLAKQVKDLNGALDQFKVEAKALIDANAAEIAKKADQTTVDALKKMVDDLKPIVDQNVKDIAALRDDLKKAKDVIDAAIKGLQADVAGLKEADIQLQNNIDAVIDAYKKADIALEELLKEAIADGDKILQDQINDIVKDYKAADFELSNKIDSVIKYSIAGDEALKNEIDAAIAESKLADSLLDVRISNAIAMSADADTVLQRQITAAVAEYIELNRVLTGNVAALKAKAIEADSLIKVAYEAADAAIQAQIDSISAVCTKLDDAYKTADGKLDEAIKTLQAQMGDVLAMVQSITFIPGSYNHQIFGSAEEAGIHNHNWNPTVTPSLDYWTYDYTFTTFQSLWDLIINNPTEETASVTFPYIKYTFTWTTDADGEHAHALVGATKADVLAQDFYLNYKGNDAVEYSNPTFSATFMVTPAAKAAKVTKDNLAIRVVSKSTTKAWAQPADDDLVKITYVEADAKTGYVNVIGYIKNAKPSERLALGVDAVAIFKQANAETGVVEEVASNPFNIVSAAAVNGVEQDGNSVKPITFPAKAIYYAVFDKSGEQPVHKDTVKCDPKIVYPSTPKSEVAKAIFDPGRFEVYAKIDIEDRVAAPLTEIAGYIGATVDQIKPAVGDTVVFDINPSNQLISRVATTKGFDTKTSTGANTVVKVLQEWLDGRAQNNLKSVLTLKNSQLALEHQADPTFVNEAWKNNCVFGAYVVLPEVDDTTAYFVSPNEIKETIAWDWRKATNPLVDELVISPLAVSDADSLIILNGNNWRHENIAGLDTNFIVSIENAESHVKYAAAGSNLAKVNSHSVAATIVAPGIEYGVADSTYIYKVARFDFDRVKIYTASFMFKVAARPAPISITLEQIDTVVNNTDRSYNIYGDDFFTALVDEIAQVSDGGVKDNEVNGAFKVAADISSQIDASKSYIDYTRTTVRNFDVTYDAPVVVTNTYKIFGVDVTVSRTINFIAPAVTLAPITEYLTGAEGVYAASVKGYANASTNWVYTLETMPFHQYMKVAGNDRKFKLNAGISTNAIGVEIASPAVYTMSPENVRFEQNDTISWGAFKKLNFVTDVALRNESFDTLDVATIEFSTYDPIPTFTAETVEVTEAFDGETVAKICPSISAVDYKGVELVNAVANRLFTQYGPFLTNYSQKLEISTELEGPEDLLPYASIVGNKFILAHNQARLTKPVEFKTTATLTYCLGQKTVDIVIIVNPAEL